MKKKSPKFIKRVIYISFFLLCLCGSYDINAQFFPGKGKGPPPNPGNNPFQQVPIDGGLLYLLAAGISFGIYKLRGKKKNQ